MPRPRKALDFDKHVKSITRVAGVKRAPEQMSLEEQIPARAHDLVRIVAGEWDYVAHCTCGWTSRGMVGRADAGFEFRKHLARTQQGAALISTLRRVGRSSNGS